VTVDAIPVLSVGVITGGTSRETTAWRRAAAQLGLAVEDLRGVRDAPVRVNVVFEIPGEVSSPPFAGVRTGRYSKADRHLLVQVAVPRGSADTAVLLDLLRDAIAAAVDWSRARGLADDLPVQRSIVERLSESVRDGG
jgi:hypothetical protein